MNNRAKEYLDNMLNNIWEKDYKVVLTDIENIEKQYKQHHIVFPDELKEFYLKYNEVIKSNISLENILLPNEIDLYFPKIRLGPLLSNEEDITTVKFLLEMVIYDGYNEFLDGLIPLGTDIGGAIVCYKINSGHIIEYNTDFEDGNDYKIVATSLDELFGYIII